MEKKDDYKMLLSRLDEVSKKAQRAKRDSMICMIVLAIAMAVLFIGVLNGVRLNLGY